MAEGWLLQTAVVMVEYQLVAGHVPSHAQALGGVGLLSVQGTLVESVNTGIG